jgi:hypothetical protein
VTSSLL